MPKKGILISCSEEGLEPATKHGLNHSITTSVVKGFTVTRPLTHLSLLVSTDVYSQARVLQLSLGTEGQELWIKMDQTSVALSSRSSLDD